LTYLGIHLTDDLTWTVNTQHTLKKSRQRLYFLRQLRKFRASSLGMGTVQPVTAVPHHHCGTVAQLLALLPHSKKVMGSIPAWGAVGSGGQVLPRVHSAQVGYLPGLSVWNL